MTATVTHIQSGIVGKMQRMLEGWIGSDPWPREDGVSYEAYGVSDQAYYGVTDELPKVMAFVVVHADAGCAIPDAVFADIDEAEARSIARSYRIDPYMFGYRYRIDHLETDIASPTLGKPLAQAMGMAIMAVQEPPRVPLQLRSWRHALVFHRICDLHEAEGRQCRGCWNEDGEMGKEPPYDDLRVSELIADAKDRLEHDDVDRADQFCEEAERVMVQRVQSSEGGGTP
jgi:hypothetical protein